MSIEEIILKLQEIIISLKSYQDFWEDNDNDKKKKNNSSVII